jgi:predicted nucleic acid-binding protein
VILLDTNVISALMRRQPEPAVVTWLDAQPAESIWTTAITVFEIRMGIQLLDPDDRRWALTEAFEALLRVDLDGRIVPFDTAAATAAAGIAASRRRSGRTVEFRDVEIAGIVSARKATLATRYTRHFDGLGLTLVDPWV